MQNFIQFVIMLVIYSTDYAESRGERSGSRNHLRCHRYQSYGIGEDFCHDILHNKSIILNRNKTIDQEHIVAIFFSLIEPMKNEGAKAVHKHFKLWMATQSFDKCSDKYQELIEAFDRVNSIPGKDIYDCLVDARWFICHQVFPTCSHYNDSSEWTKEKICNSECHKIHERGKCEKFLSYIEALYKVMRPICPSALNKKLPIINQISCKGFNNDSDENCIREPKRPHTTVKPNASRKNYVSVTLVVGVSAGTLIALALAVIAVIICRKKQQGKSLKSELGDSLTDELIPASERKSLSSSNMVI